jgi:hypothetical protein
MATLSIAFNTSANAVKYRINYRVVGTTAYTSTFSTTSPKTITVPCGSSYEGTVEAICIEGVPCNRYKVQNTSPSVAGTLSLTDCATGYQNSMVVAAASEYFVCSRNTPVPSSGILATTTVVQVAQDNCVTTVPEEASGLVYWTAAAAACAYYYTVSVCPSSTNTTLPPNNEVKSNTSIPIGTVVNLTGVPYVDGCYTITAVSVLQTSAVNVAQTFSNCNACIA